jgi:PAS domain S-box-containing protein
MRVLVLQKPKPWLGYGSAVLLAVLAQVCRIPMHPATAMPFITYVPFLLLAAWYSGFGPGILASVLCTLEAIYFATDPVGTFRVSDPRQWIGVSILALIGFISASLFENLKLENLKRTDRTDALALKRFDALRDHLALIVESSEDAILSKNLDGTILSWNRAAERIFGYSAEEVIGNLVLRIIPPELHAEELSIASQIQLGQKVEPFNTVRMHKDGRRVPISLSISPIRNAQGEVIGASKIARDISAQKQAEEQFRTIVEEAPNAMLIVNREGRIRLVNRKTEELFGYRRDELLQQSLEMLMPLRYRAQHPAKVRNFFEKPQNRDMDAKGDFYGQRKDGSEFPLELGLSFFQDGEQMLALASIFDVSKRKDAENELARSNRDLERFAYLASHDLQEPLRAVSGCLQLLEQRYRGQLDEPAGEWIGHAVDGAARMRVLIEALLSYSLVSKGGNPLQPVDCNAALEMALRNLSVSIKESGVEISREPLPMVAGIPSYLDMLFQNLIGNAIKFRRLDLPAKVHIGAELKEGYWVISISDNGIGIEEQYFDRIFSLFQRLHTRTEYPGTGIGLALCKRIAEQHEGKITVTSTPGEGSCFSFTLRPADRS